MPPCRMPGAVALARRGWCRGTVFLRQGDQSSRTNHGCLAPRSHCCSSAFPGSTTFTRMHPSTAQQLAARSTSFSYCSMAARMSAPSKLGSAPATSGFTEDGDDALASERGAAAMPAWRVCGPSPVVRRKLVERRVKSAVSFTRSVAFPYSFDTQIACGIFGRHCCETDRDCAPTSTRAAPGGLLPAASLAAARSVSMSSATLGPRRASPVPMHRTNHAKPRAKSLVGSLSRSCAAQGAVRCLLKTRDSSRPRPLLVPSPSQPGVSALLITLRAGSAVGRRGQNT